MTNIHPGLIIKLRGLTETAGGIYSKAMLARAAGHRDLADELEVLARDFVHYARAWAQDSWKPEALTAEGQRLNTRWDTLMAQYDETKVA